MLKANNSKFMNSNRDRVFRCTFKDNQRMKFEEVLQMYVDFLHDDFSNMGEVSFWQYLSDEISNGELVEVKYISREEQREVGEAAIEFCEAFSRLRKALGCVSEDSFNEHLSKNYPFKHSFDEVSGEVCDWCGDIFINSPFLESKENS